MDGIAEFAKLLKERENPTVQGIGLGVVTAPPPNVAVKFNTFNLDKDNLIVPEHLMQVKTTSSVVVPTHGSHTHTVDYTLKVGDSVIVIPSIDNAKYYVVGKVI